MNHRKILIPAAIVALLCACARHEPDDTPLRLYPDYADGLVIPCNIAPLNFDLCSPETRYKLCVKACDKAGGVLMETSWKTRRKVRFKLSMWRKFTACAARSGGYLQIEISPLGAAAEVANGAAAEAANGTPAEAANGTPAEAANGASAGAAFGTPVANIRRWQVSPDSIDPYLIYRSGPFDENQGDRLQVCQRNLQDFSVKILMDNALTENNCMNCHTVSSCDAARMVVHIRGERAGTLVIQGDSALKIGIPAEYGFRLSYPAWNPRYPYIAFATTRIHPFAYLNHCRTQDLMFDQGGSIVIYDIAENRLIRVPLLADTAFQYAFPAWGPDGKTLYFCRADNLIPTQLKPETRKESLSGFRYSLYKMAFKPETRQFDSLQCVYPLAREGVSASMPYVHSEGRYILLSALAMGSFPSQNQGDLYLVDNLRQEARPAEELNSPDSDHCGVWSGNGKWVVFGSKRESGANSLFYIAHFEAEEAEEAEEVGEAAFSHPFIVPLKNPADYTRYNRSLIFPVLSRTSSALTPALWREYNRREALTPDLSDFTPKPASTDLQAGH